MIVIKRDGRSAPFNAEKIEIAILKAMIQVGQVDESKARKISLELENNFKEKKEISIYSIENAVIASLFREKRDDVARAYKSFRNESLCIGEVGVDLELCVHDHGHDVDPIMETSCNNNYFLGIISSGTCELILCYHGFDHD